MRRNNYSQKGLEKEKPISYTRQFKVNHSDELLAFLLQKLDLSRNSVKALLGSSKILVNGKVVKQFNYPLAKDDEVKIAKEPVKVEVYKKLPKKAEARRQPKNLKILYEDEYLIAVNKPSGLLSVQSDTSRESAYAYVADYLKAKDPKSRPFVLHRIDKDTSGVLVFAKDITIHSKLKGYWAEDVKLREYIAVCHGQMEEKEKTLVSYLKENNLNMVFVGRGKDGKKAITHYEVIAENQDYSLLRVKIDTGRKNQIRVQLAHIGHPIVGDEKYGEKECIINRLGLHASELDFYHPIKKEIIKIKAPIPTEFNNLFSKKKRA